MGKKGKSKNKLAKMSEEERARYMQMRADIEEEARRRKQQLIALYMKNKLKREEAFARLNLAKINQEWRSILRQIKCQELKNEISAMEKSFDQTIERKNQFIQRLLKEVDIAEDMYATMYQSQNQLISRLIRIHLDRLSSLKQNYENNKSSFLQETQMDLKNLQANRDMCQDQLECAFYHVERVEEQEQKANEEEYFRKVDDLRSTMQLELEKITDSREQKLDRLWAEYQNALNAYVQNTESFYADYMELKETDDQNTKLTQEHCNEMQRTTDEIAKLKLTAIQVEENRNFQIEQLTKIREDLSEQFKQERKEFKMLVEQERDIFQFVAVISHETLKFLDKFEKKGETLLQLSAACRKLESEREQIFPQGRVRKPKQAFETPVDRLREPPVDLLSETDFGNVKQMANFWYRVNSVRLDVLCLEQEKKILEKENAELKADLEEYLVELNVSTGCNRHANDYFSKRRPQSMSTRKLTPIDLPSKSKSAGGGGRSRPITTCIDANLTNAVRSKSLTDARHKLAKIKMQFN